MRISITVAASDVQVSNDFIQLDLSPEMTFDDLKAFVEAEINVPPSAQMFKVGDSLVTRNAQSIASMGVNDGDIIELAIRTKTARSQPAPATDTSRPQNSPDPELLRLQILGDPRLIGEIRAQDPELAESASDSERFRSVWEQRTRQRAVAQREKEAYINQLNDEWNEDAQAKIEEMIRQERVMENMQKAYEENPESFGHVTMLYIDVLVNNVPIKAFVDSGAQTTIMSPSAAERCGIMRLIDKRFAGIARGVGTAQILGRVHSAEIQIGQYSLASSFTVMEGKDVDLLLGLDMLKRHQMCIDLKDNCLRVANDQVSFLPESEIPKMMEAVLENEPKVQGPDGMKIGATTGTVEPAAQASSSSSTQPSQASSSKIKIHPAGSAGNISSNQTQRPLQSAGRSTAQPSPSVGSAPRPDPVTEEKIRQVMEVGGFSRPQAVEALRAAGGNVDAALAALIGF